MKSPRIRTCARVHAFKNTAARGIPHCQFYSAVKREARESYHICRDMCSDYCQFVIAILAHAVNGFLMYDSVVSLRCSRWSCHSLQLSCNIYYFLVDLYVR